MSASSRYLLSYGSNISMIDGREFLKPDSLYAIKAWRFPVWLFWGCWSCLVLWVCPPQNHFWVIVIICSYYPSNQFLCVLSLAIFWSFLFFLEYWSYLFFEWCGSGRLWRRVGTIVCRGCLARMLGTPYIRVTRLSDLFLEPHGAVPLGFKPGIFENAIRVWLTFLCLEPP